MSKRHLTVLNRNQLFIHAPRRVEDDAVCHQWVSIDKVVQLRGGRVVKESRENAAAGAGSANIRRPQPFDSSVVSKSLAGRRPASASSTRAATAPGVSRSRVSPGEQTQGPVAAPPNAPPPHSVGQRRVEGSSCLSLTRPVRASRLRVVRQLPVGVAGSWRSPPGVIVGFDFLAAGGRAADVPQGVAVCWLGRLWRSSPTCGTASSRPLVVQQ